MQFSLAINMERGDAVTDMREVAADTLAMVQMAEAGGFGIVWITEHHAIEQNISPAPFQLMAFLAAHTSRIRLGSAVAVAPYWHPVKLAGEAALFDLLSNGRLEFGIGRGAYQREFDIMAAGIPQREGGAYMQEMLPVLKALWQGDFAHDGRYWSFPIATSVPKPLQQPYPPLWVAARDPATYDWAVANGCNILSWAIARPFSEVELYKRQFETAAAKHPELPRPKFLAMRWTAVYTDPDGWDIPVKAIIRRGAQFENLFKNLGGVTDGFAHQIDLASIENRAEYQPAALCENLMFGTPRQVIAKLDRYRELGVDDFCYSTSYGLPMAFQKRSLRLFIDEVMPAFA